MKLKEYDCIVVGAGHAGVEAAMAAARMGCSVLFLTMNLETVGLMSCNPAIGGIGKGQLVKEIDALGGCMARAADDCGIQFRLLNSSKGPAVRSSRAQQDMRRYKEYVRSLLEGQENLCLYQAEVTRILSRGSAAVGVKTSCGEEFFGRTIVITPGTFLNGLIHIGLTHFSGGRLGEAAASGLPASLKDMGFRMGRFKTGTCPRLDKRSIDFTKLIRQDGDSTPLPFSFSTPQLRLSQVPCYITYTNPRTHDVIRAGLDESPLYTGKIQATGVRYCPSIEDKIVRFADRQRHQVFLEPQGLDTVEIYPNGISTSLPVRVQMEMLHSMEGLQKARMTRPGYGIEHDYVDPTQLYPTLETKLRENLFLAGQINGTTGYEEAAAQGLVAGINAALKARQEQPFVLGRHESYIGVLIDDLTTKGTNEPYRMFTSRVEYRLVLREDNADLRLGEYGARLGLVDQNRQERLEEKKRKISRGLEYFHSRTLKPREVNPFLESRGMPPVERSLSLEELLRRPQIALKELMALDHMEEHCGGMPMDVAGQIETQIKYDGFIRRQTEEVERMKKIERIKIPAGMNYACIQGLSREIIEKLERAQPWSLGHAARISGVTPAAVSLLMVWIHKRSKTAPEGRG